ncbi:hypothetical protein HMPREF0454_01544 [Hafnia alvei ATCC 51873]|uniref:Uncharacterized protein n=1 Tax=Hafnia alvei ATCC 51873 TaxID=1002364 RepID=G9Y4X1_HAFAL|nr:hypothetical protein HMPREF0454_01544 [Hafnia alvei ATCC 51873]
MAIRMFCSFNLVSIPIYNCSYPTLKSLIYQSIGYKLSKQNFFPS